MHSRMKFAPVAAVVLFALAPSALAAGPQSHEPRAAPSKHIAAPAHPAIHPGTAMVRMFAETAIGHLKGPAQRPFRKLLASLPAADKEPGVTISKKTTRNMQCSGGVCTPTASIAVLNVNDLTRLLTDGAVTVQTTSEAPDIFVNAPFNWTGANALALQAIGNIVVNRKVSAAGSAPLDLEYDVNGSGDGQLSFGAKGSISFTELANPLTINGESYTLAADIQTLARLIDDNPSGNFALARNYNARRDGIYTQSPINLTFAGKFDGLGNGISNFHLECSGCGDDETPVGFVQAIGPTAYWGNVNMSEATIIYNGYPTYALGGWAGYNQGTIFNSSFSGDVSTADCDPQGSVGSEAGGLVGINDGDIEFSHAAGSVSVASDAAFCAAGGLAGESGFLNDAQIRYSYATASVSASAPEILAGGLAGGVDFSGYAPDSLIDSSYATGAITVTTALIAEVGGLAGLAGGTSEEIDRSSASGAVTITNTTNGGGADGGLVGENFGTISNDNVAIGSVSVLGSQTCYCGGALGSTFTPVSDTTSYGSVTAPAGSTIGGFVGYDYTYNGGSNALSNDGWCTTSSGFTDIHHGAGNVADDPGITPFTC